jgi:glycerol-3-phosphate cytidylyltransferase
VTKVLTVGVFDLMHYGHHNCISCAASLGDYLIVGVHTDDGTTKGCTFSQSYETRAQVVAEHPQVNQVVLYDRVDLLVEKLEFDVFAYGPDQNHFFFQQAFEWCRRNGKKIILIPRTEGISSTMLRHSGNHAVVWPQELQTA